MDEKLFEKLKNDVRDNLWVYGYSNDENLIELGALLRMLKYPLSEDELKEVNYLITQKLDKLSDEDDVTLTLAVIASFKEELNKLKSEIKDIVEKPLGNNILAIILPLVIKDILLEIADLDPSKASSVALDLFANIFQAVKQFLPMGIEVVNIQDSIDKLLNASSENIDVEEALKYEYKSEFEKNENKKSS
jgi:hypothetical protein